VLVVEEDRVDQQQTQLLHSEEWVLVDWDKELMMDNLNQVLILMV
jgi:hypothetical protein